MSKKNATYFCKECGYETTGWMGKCPGCGSFGTLVVSTSVTGSQKSNDSKSELPSLKADRFSWTSLPQTVRLPDAGREDYLRFPTGVAELDALFGGGITSGSVTLLGGEPGIGKSTILLQLADSFDGTVLYVSGEESPAQIKMRADRLKVKGENTIICAQTCFEVIAEELSKAKPALCIIDSIQTLYSESVSGAPGSVTQAREVTAGLIRIAKSCALPVILVGHVTKEGSIAGPKTLEHMVDTVLYFEGDNTGSYRILRSVKNRFGRSGELAFFEMTSTGLRSVDSSNALLVTGRPMKAPGSAITCTLEGARALAIEIQALTADTCYGTPQRQMTGPDRSRTSMLLAVAEQNFKLNLNIKDVFINVIGGLRVTDPACDLALIAAVVSAARGTPLRSDTMVLGEVGLAGELRPVSSTGLRIDEARRLGIRHIVLPSSCKNGIKDISNMEFLFVDNVSEAADVLFS